MKTRNLIGEIKEIISSSLNRATFFQFRFFILEKEPTMQAKIHKCVEELKLRHNSIENAYMELEDLDDKIELLELERGVLDDTPKGKILTRQANRKIKFSKQQKEVIKDRIKGLEEEALFFVEAYKMFIEKEPQKCWDDPVVQLEYWDAKYGKEIKDRLLMNMPLDLELIRSVLVLPEDASIKKQVIQLLQTQQNKMLKQ